MTSVQAAPIVCEADKLGRDVLSKKDQRRIQRGDAPPGLFLDSASPVEISVNRLSPEADGAVPMNRPDLAPDSTIAKIGDRRASARGRHFYGWAEISVGDARANGREVRASPLEDNFWHADIMLPSKASEDRRAHAQDLAFNAVWRPRPGVTA